MSALNAAMGDKKPKRIIERPKMVTAVIRSRSEHLNGSSNKLAGRRKRRFSFPFNFIDMHKLVV